MKPNEILHYFLYSQEQINEKDRVEAKRGKRFVCGTVSVGNQSEKFSHLSTKPSLGNRYPDCKIVAKGYLSEMRYSMPKTDAKR